MAWLDLSWITWLLRDNAASMGNNIFNLVLFQTFTKTFESLLKIIKENKTEIAIAFGIIILTSLIVKIICCEWTRRTLPRIRHEETPMNVQQVCNSPRLTHQGMETLMSSQERPQIIAAMPAASDSSSIASSARSATANVNRQNQAAQNPAGNSSPVASNPNNEQASQEVKSQDGNTIPPNQLAQNLQSQLNQSQP